MEEWIRYRLGDICTIYGRIGFRGYTTEDLTSNPAEGAISLSPTNIVGGELDLSKPTYIKWDKYEESPEIMLRPNDVVIVKTGSSVGRTALIRDVTHPITLNPQLVVLKDIKINPVFLSYLVKTSRFQGLLKSITVGSAIPTLSQKNLANLPVDIPNESGQKKIADILNSLDEKILLNNRINHNLEEQIQERFDSMIMSDNGLGYCQIADYVDVNPKRSLKKNEPAKCVDMSYLSTTGPFPSGWETKGYNGGMKFMNGDTIVARITPCLENGKVAYVNFLDDGEVAFGSTEFIVLHAKEGVSPVFTYFLARNKSFVDYATKNMNGSSGRQRVSGDTIEKYLIPVIDSEPLNEFSSYATPAMEVIRNNSFESRSLAATRDAMLPLLLSGKLSISQMNV